VNEGFRSGGRGGGAQPDPLVALDDANKALRHKLLAVPALRARYLAYMGEIAEKWLDWSRLGPIVERYQKLIADDVARDTRKLDTTEAFTRRLRSAGRHRARRHHDQGLRRPAPRRAALLAHPEIVKARRR
jgi:hypothetical protein